MTHGARLLPTAAGLVAMAALVAACGGSDPSDSAAPDREGTTASSRTVEIAMEDIRFDSTALSVQAGETIDFRFTNNGAALHDAFIGGAEEQAEHDAEMAGMGAMASHSGEDPAITVEPGDTGALTYTFDEPGTYEIGCHQPGHYAAGMKIEVTVT